MRTISHFINGQRVTGTSAVTSPVYNPATGQAQAILEHGDTAILADAVAVAKAAQPAWAATDPQSRARVIFKFKALIEEHKQELRRTSFVEGEQTMAEFMWESVDRPRIGRQCGNDRRATPKLKPMLVVISAMLGILLQGCTADKHPSQGETTLANAAKDVTIPLEAGKMKNPLAETDEVASQGQEVFLGSCAQCHGADGRGDTEVGRNMAPPAMDLSSSHVQHWSDAELYWIIQNGVRLTGMPAWKSSISDTDTWKLARFIHNLSRLDAVSASGAVPPQSQAAAPTQNKYAVKIPNGLAFSEFRGYEGWPVIAVSHNGDKLAAILGNTEMIDALKSGIPGNGKSFPDGARMAKVHWNAKVNAAEPGAPTVPGTQHDVDFMLKDRKRFANSGGWGYGAFEYDAASNTFTPATLKDKPPQGKDATCGFACHSAVKTKDYVFTDYGQR